MEAKAALDLSHVVEQEVYKKGAFCGFVFSGILLMEFIVGIPTIIVSVALILTKPSFSFAYLFSLLALLLRGSIYVFHVFLPHLIYSSDLDTLVFAEDKQAMAKLKAQEWYRISTIFFTDPGYLYDTRSVTNRRRLGSLFYMFFLGTIVICIAFGNIIHLSKNCDDDLIPPPFVGECDKKSFQTIITLVGLIIGIYVVEIRSTYSHIHRMDHSPICPPTSVFTKNKEHKM